MTKIYVLVRADNVVNITAVIILNSENMLRNTSLER